MLTFQRAAITTTEYGYDSLIGSSFRHLVQRWLCDLDHFLSNGSGRDLCPFNWRADN